ncbi:MAG: cephalosporin hydroxylase [Acidobacteria bacterium]|nr:cephalosporin hydroxylase [Acidobacteriota bacterium]
MEPRDPELIAEMAADPEVRELAQKFFAAITARRYSYNFTWLGRPIIQYPQDIVAMQQVIWDVQPDVIVETGIAHGGSLIFHASMLELIGGDREVIGIDIDVRAHNRTAIEAHPLARRIRMIEGSSIDEAIVQQVFDAVASRKRCLVVLDSNHTHDHVLRELELYSPLVRAGSYLIVFDTVIEQLPEDFYPDRPWSRGNNPMTAVKKFMESNDRFEVDRELEDSLLLTVAPGGYLRCVRD